MDTLIDYLIKSVSVSGFLLLYYVAVLRNRKFHSFNRVYLISILMASVILPLVRLSWLRLSWLHLSWLRFPWLRLRSAGGQPLDSLITGISSHPSAIPSFPVMATVLALCVAVSVVLLLVLVARIFAVYRLKRQHPSQRMEGCRFIEIEDRRAPFSFLDNLFWQKGSDIKNPINRKIFTHELAHIRGRHTYDTLFVQALTGIFWMNPFYWLIRRELVMVHEFIADDASIAAGDTESFARMLLQAYEEGRYLDPSHRFFQSPIKRRLVMISSSQRSSRYFFRKLLAIPALLAVIVLSCSKEQAVTPAEQKSGQPEVVNFKGDIKVLPGDLKLSLNKAFKKSLLQKISYYSKTGELKEVNLTIDTILGKNQLEHIQFSGQFIPNEPSGQ